jgi:hypothetical protein
MRQPFIYISNKPAKYIDVTDSTPMKGIYISRVFLCLSLSLSLFLTYQAVPVTTYNIVGAERR